jgi:hypothetical protein
MGVNETREAATNLLIYRGENWQINGHTWGSKKGKEHIGLIYEEIPAEELAQMSPPPKTGYKLTFTARKGIPIGPLVETVTLDTTPKASTPVTICIYGHVTPCVALMMHQQLRLENNLLYLGSNLPQGTAQGVDLKIRLAGEHRNTTKFSVKKVVPEDLKVSFGEPKANYGGHSFLVPLKIELPATAKPQAWLSANPEEMGQIVIETTNPEAKELKILVRFSIAEPTAPAAQK